jgi:hypothetical protein
MQFLIFFDLLFSILYETFTFSCEKELNFKYVKVDM